MRASEDPMLEPKSGQDQVKIDSKSIQAEETKKCTISVNCALDEYRMMIGKFIGS